MNTDAVCPWPEPPLRPQAGVTGHSGRTGPEHSRKLHKVLSIVPAFGKPSTTLPEAVKWVLAEGLDHHIPASWQDRGSEHRVVPTPPPTPIVSPAVYNLRV